MPTPRTLTALRRRSPAMLLCAALTIPAPATATSSAGGVAASPAAAAGVPSQAASSGPQPEVRLTRGRVREVQRALGVAADGKAGRRTRSALRRYQRQNELPVSGRVTLETLRHLQGASGAASAAAPQAGASAVTKAVRRRIGAAYRMGATGPNRYDCSGLTVEAFAAAGITLARTSYDQYKQGTPVARNEIRAGDLVFFNAAGPGASHVGIATGRTTLISATTSRGVIEHRLNDSYWGSRYLGARRMAR